MQTLPICLAYFPFTKTFISFLDTSLDKPSAYPIVTVATFIVSVAVKLLPYPTDCPGVTSLTIATLHLNESGASNFIPFGKLSNVSSSGSDGTPYNMIPGLAKS